MNVTLITMAYPHPRAGFWPGIERQVGDFSEALRDAGARVTVITSFRNGGEAFEDHDGIRIHRLADTGFRFGKLGYIRGAHVRSLAAAAMRLTDVIEKSDVIESFIPLATRHVPALSGRLFAFFAHRDRPSRWTDYLVLPAIHQMNKVFFGKVDRIIVASSESARVLRDEYDVPAERIETIPLGVSPEFLAGNGHRPEKDLGNRCRLLYVGPLIRRKGLRTLLEALPGVRNAGHDFQVVLAGHGPEREYLETRARELGLADRVEFPGFVAENELISLYRSADIFVFPSVKEGFGLVLVEAMASDLPIVASAAPPIPEVVGDAALLFEPESIEDLSSALTRMIADEGLRHRYSAAGKRRVLEEYDWRRIAERTLSLYAKVVS